MVSFGPVGFSVLLWFGVPAGVCIVPTTVPFRTTGFGRTDRPQEMNFHVFVLILWTTTFSSWPRTSCPLPPDAGVALGGAPPSGFLQFLFLGPSGALLPLGWWVPLAALCPPVYCFRVVGLGFLALVL